MEVFLSVKLDGLLRTSLMVMEPVVPRWKCYDWMQVAPPRNAMRQIHAHRQEERKQREQEKEAEEFENEMSMTLAFREDFHRQHPLVGGSKYSLSKTFAFE